MAVNRRRYEPNGMFTPRWVAASQRKPDKGLLAVLLRYAGPTFVDIGAGMGVYVRALIASGRHGYGVDGVEGIEALTHGLVVQRDLSAPVAGLREMHTGICTEVGEHIPKEHEAQLWRNIDELTGSLLILSWSGSLAGTGHVNPLHPDVVAAKVQHLGFWVDRDMTEAMRKVAGRGWNTKLWAAWR